MSKRTTNKLIKLFVVAIVIIVIAVAGKMGNVDNAVGSKNEDTYQNAANLSNIPEYSGSAYVYINNNVPNFSEEMLKLGEIEYYSELDELDRCGITYANICKKVMPAEDEERESISNVIPSGWIQASYKGVIEGNYLYNRCHLIGYQLAGENANRNNLITGTRYMNTEGMLPFENMVAEYVDEHPNNHVIYRVTPVFEGTNLVASGVQMEAYSVEDNGKGISFNIYVYNVQPGIVIDYSTGESRLE